MIPRPNAGDLRRNFRGSRPRLAISSRVETHSLSILCSIDQPLSDRFFLFDLFFCGIYLFWIFVQTGIRWDGTMYTSQSFTAFFIHPYLPRCHILATLSLELTFDRTRFKQSVTAVVTGLPAGIEGGNPLGGHGQHTRPGRPRRPGKRAPCPQVLTGPRGVVL